MGGQNVSRQFFLLGDDCSVVDERDWNTLSRALSLCIPIAEGGGRRGSGNYSWDLMIFPFFTAATVLG
jgi:hypothetical protein